MGIKGLWNVLAPYSEKKSMHEICGQTLAVDLSGWICDSQNVTNYYIQPKLYLRTVYLLLADIDPIFVLEGDAPELKRDVMTARINIQFKGVVPLSGTARNKQSDISRKRFKNVLKECESLLKCMGVKCIKGRGEAEATCAVMNAHGLVDAVVSQDSDCFAYGARRVYRNFSVSSSAGGGALQGSVDCYDAQAMFDSNGFGRNKMVALALLCGCDYGEGACGSSINTVVSFLHTIPEDEIIQRLLSWITEPEVFEQKSRWVSLPGRCDRCGHAGRKHTRLGCPTCGTHRGCTDQQHKSKVSEVKRELSLRSRAVSCGMPFPEPKVMEEFLNSDTEKIDMDSLRQPVPSLIKFVKLMTSKLDWSERYCVEKFLPLLTKWHLQDNVISRTIMPVMIKKKRNPRGVPSFEVVWGDFSGQYEGLIPDDQFEEDEDTNAAWTTTERQDLMRKYYPTVVKVYEESIKKSVKEKKTKARKNKVDDPEKPKRKYTKKTAKTIDSEIYNLSNSFKNIALDLNESALNKSKGNVSVKVNKLKRKLKERSKGKGQKTIDYSFIKNKRRISEKMNLNESALNKSKGNVSVKVNKLKRNLKERSRGKGQKTIDSFIKNKRRKSENMSSLHKSLRHVSMIEDKQMDNAFTEFISDNQENIEDWDNLEESDDYDLSDIVDNIITRAPIEKAAKVNNDLYKLVFKNSTPKKSLRTSLLNSLHQNCSTPNESPKNNTRFSANVSHRSSCSKVNTSYFFDKLSEKRDAFEISFDYKHKSAIVNCDATIDSSLPDVCL